MGPSHTITDRADGRDAHPLESFVQLVVPQPMQAISGCGVVATLHPDLAEFKLPSRTDFDSPDDLLAEVFPRIDPMLRDALRRKTEEFISSIRAEVSRSFSPENEGIVPREWRVDIRYGASRCSPEAGPIVWVECRCLETGCYMIPRLREGMCGSGWFGNADDELPERFFDGPALLMIEFYAECDEVVRCFPLVSAVCEGEAERHLMVAL